MNSSIEQKHQQNQPFEQDLDPLVSIIISFYNQERFLQEAIESVLAQTYRNWELLLVDDGSTDKSTGIARAYVESHPEKFAYLEHAEHKNRGVSVSRNLGIEKASGVFVAFLDADDVWLPDKLHEQVDILLSHPEAGMLYGLSRWWYSWTGDQESPDRDFVLELGVPSGSLLDTNSLLTQFFFTQKAAIPTPTNILIRREILEKVGGFEERFPEKYILYEDQMLYVKISLANPVLPIDQCWDLYRQHPWSAVAVAQERGWDRESRLFFLNWLFEYLKAFEFKGNDVWRDLRKEIWRTRLLIFAPVFINRKVLYERMKNFSLRFARKVLPTPVRGWLWSLVSRTPYLPPVGWVRFGHLRRLSPFSKDYGYERGTPIDRYYIESFLKDHELEIRGRVLEIADNSYTRQYGGDRVNISDVMHAMPGNPKATIVGDLTQADQIPTSTFDCIILTQTLQVIYNYRAAIKTIHRILKPGGVALITVPGISPISTYDLERWGYFWSFTSLAARRLFEEYFPVDHVTVQSYGNILAATSFLYGLATQELRKEELDQLDPAYEVIVAVRAKKPTG
jgi:glycosyltransferase involved in cell wall biosynthesis